MTNYQQMDDASRLCELLFHRGEDPGHVFGTVPILPDRYATIKTDLLSRREYLIKLIIANYAIQLAECMKGLPTTITPIGFLLRVYRNYGDNHAGLRFCGHLISLRSIISALHAVEIGADRTINYQPIDFSHEGYPGWMTSL